MSGRPQSQTYIARAACGCIHLLVSVYKGQKPSAFVTQQIAWAMSEGYDIQRVSTEHVREHFTGHCDVCCPPVPEQTSLLTSQTEVH